MDDKLFQELLEKLHGLKELFQQLTDEERWAFLYVAIVMVTDMDKPGKETE